MIDESAIKSYEAGVALLDGEYLVRNVRVSKNIDLLDVILSFKIIIRD
jgi:hypothetical protein